jgi:hypothetical protein
VRPSERLVDGVVVKTCPRCTLTKPATLKFFLPRYEGGKPTAALDSWCRSCRNAGAAEWVARNRKARAASQRRRNQAIRLRVLIHYSGDPPSCQCCGETELVFLAIDHEGGGGSKHAKAIGGGGSKLAKWIVDHDFPPGFRILCHNCNHGTHLAGVCPHVARRTDPVYDGGTR